MLSCFSRVWLCATLCYGPQPARLLCPWDSSGKNTRVGCHALLQGIFLTQGSNPGLLHRRWVFTIWATKEAQQRLQSYPRQVTKSMVVTNTSSPRSFSKAAFISASNPVPALFIPSSFPRPHYTVHLRILCTEHPVFFFTICPQALPLVPADADTRRPLASGVAGDPGAQSFKLFDLSTQDLRGCSPTKIKFIWPWKFGLDWHDREERFFFFPVNERVQTKLQKQTCQSISSQRVRSESQLISKKQRSAPPWTQGLKTFCFVQPARGVMSVLRSEWLRDQSASGKLIRWCYGLGHDTDAIESRKKKIS